MKSPSALIEAVEIAIAERDRCQTDLKEANSKLRDAVVDAVKGGIDPADLARKPWSEGFIRRLAREAGLPRRPPGPPPQPRK